MIAFFLDFSRAFLGTTFALSFLAKARHFASFVATIHAFRLLPTPVVKPAAALILAAELAILLLLGSGLLWSYLSECGRLLHDIRQASRQEGSR